MANFDIDTGGNGDYASLNAFQSAEAGSLTGAVSATCRASEWPNQCGQTSNLNTLCFDTDDFAIAGNSITPSADRTVKNISCWVDSIQGSPADFVAEVWTMDGADDLVTKLVTSDAETMVTGKNTFTFTTPIDISSGTKYALVICHADYSYNGSNNADLDYADAAGNWDTGEEARAHTWVGSTKAEANDWATEWKMEFGTHLPDTALGVDLAGWTTTSANTLTIQQASGDRHNGVWRNDVYRVYGNNTLGLIDSQSPDHITFDGLQVHMYTVLGGNRQGIKFSGGTSTGAMRIVENCIFRGANEAGSDNYNFGLVFYAADTTTLAGTFHIRNNLFYDWDETSTPAGAIELWDCDSVNTPTVYVHNNTAYNCDSFITLGSDFAGAGTVICFNNLTRNCVTEYDYVSSMSEFDSSSDYNSGDISATTKAIDLNATKTAGSPWITSGDADSDYFLSAAADDFRPGYGDLHIDVGSDLSATFTSDALGSNRPNASGWDLGYIEYIWPSATIAVDTDGGGDYTTLYAAMTAQSGAQGFLTIECAGSADDTYTSQFKVPVMACTALTICAASSDRHSGILDSDNYLLVLGATTQVTKWLWEDNDVGCPVTIEGLQMRVQGGAYNAIYLEDTTSSNPETMVFDSCIIEVTNNLNYAVLGGSSSQGSSARDFTVKNCLIYGAAGNGGDTNTGTHIYGGKGLFKVYNNTIYGKSTGGNGIMARHASVTAVNNIFRNNADGYGMHEHSTGSGSFASAYCDHNSTEDGTAISFNLTKTTGSPWNSSGDADSDFFLSAAGDDYRPGNGDLHIDKGLALDALFTNDCVGTSRGTGRTLVGSDNFNRTDSDPLDGDWSTLAFVGDDLLLTGNKVLSPNTQAAGAYFSGGTPNDDQYTQATLVQGNNRFGLVARCTDSANGDFYLFQLIDSTDANFYSLTDGSWSQKGSDMTDDWNSGDVFRFEVNGTGSATTLRAYKNNMLIGAVVDADGDHTSGYAGLYSHASTVAGFDDFECGNYAQVWTLGFFEFVAGAPTKISISTAGVVSAAAWSETLSGSDPPMRIGPDGTLYIHNLSAVGAGQEPYGIFPSGSTWIFKVNASATF